MAEREENILSAQRWLQRCAFILIYKLKLPHLQLIKVTDELLILVEGSYRAKMESLESDENTYGKS